MKGMDMKSRIELELRGKQKNEIKDLNLDMCRGQQIEGLTDEFINLEVLSLINVGLTSLKGFPTLPSLRKVSSLFKLQYAK
jgi:acidic leucine-rich nuclear phosphoprotein 32 family protein A/C/D